MAARRRRRPRTGGAAREGGAPGGVPGGAREHWRADGTPKARFASADEANRASLRVRLEHGADLDPYVCEFCGGWHLGSR